MGRRMAIVGGMTMLREWSARMHWKETQGFFATGAVPQLALAGATSSEKPAIPDEAGDAATTAASERLQARDGPHTTWHGCY